MKYYLLTFNEDWADEHDVPALTCFTEEQYQQWLEQELAEPVDKTPEEYQQKLDAWNDNYNKYQEYIQLSNELQKERGGWALLTADDNKLIEEKRVSYPRDKPKQYESLIFAWLGNSGDCFGESFSHCLTGQDFITNDIVKVFEVNESFYNIFNKANLNGLSLCNIFECGQ